MLMGCIFKLPFATIAYRKDIGNTPITLNFRRFNCQVIIYGQLKITDLEIRVIPWSLLRLGCRQSQTLSYGFATYVTIGTVFTMSIANFRRFFLVMKQNDLIIRRLGSGNRNVFFNCDSYNCLF